MSTIEKAIEKMGKKSTVEKADASKQEVETALPTGDDQIAVEQHASISETVSSTDINSTQLSVTIDFNLLRMNGMVVPDDTRSRIADEYRLIKRPLIMNAFGQGASVVEHANLIMLTSSVPGEGKTFSAVNLAMSIALERDKHVLLVDADVAKPSISRLLQLGDKRGLIDILIDNNINFSDVVLKTNVPNLTILTAGTIHPHSNELIASNEMAKLTDELSKRYSDRIVIFDSPPLLATTEAGVLANHMGQVVMVVESGKTQQSMVNEALSRLNGPEIIGFILNKTLGGMMSGEYDYNYGYYGGYASSN